MVAASIGQSLVEENNKLEDALRVLERDKSELIGDIQSLRVNELQLLERISNLE